MIACAPLGTVTNARVIEAVKYWMKPLGGVTFQAWTYAALALDRLAGIDQRLAAIRWMRAASC